MVRGHGAGASVALEWGVEDVALYGCAVAKINPLYKVLCGAFKHIALRCAQEQRPFPYTHNIYHTNNIITETQGYYKIFLTNGIYFLKKIWYNVQ